MTDVLRGYYVSILKYELNDTKERWRKYFMRVGLEK